MKILLVQPGFGEGLGFQQIALVEPLGLELVAASLRENGHIVDILDLRVEKKLVDKIKKFQPTLIGISCSFAIDVYQTLKIAATIKKINKDIFVIVGGHHASLSPGDFNQPGIDAVVIGEGEITAVELVEAVEKGRDLLQVAGLAINQDGEQKLTVKRPRIKNLDNLPLPARDILHRYRKSYYLGFQRPIATIETSRGCPYRCEFCSVWNFYGGEYRVKSPERVVAEIATLREKYLLFTDDNFLQSIPRAQKIAELLLAKGIRKKITIQARSDSIVRHPEIIALWRKAGLWKIFIGFEKIADEELSALGKKNTVKNNEEALRILRAHKIEVCASFIADPQYEKNDFKRLRDYIRRWKLYSPSLTIYTPFPGTELFNRLKEKLTTKNWELYDAVHTVLPTKLSLKEFYREFSKLYKISYPRLDLGWHGLRALAKSIGQWDSFVQFWNMIRAAHTMATESYYLVGHNRNFVHDKNIVS